MPGNKADLRAARFGETMLESPVSLGEPSGPAIDPRPPAPPRRPIDDPGLRRLPLKAIDSRPPAPPGRPIDDPGLRRLPLKAIDRRPPAPPRRPIDDPGLRRLPLKAIDRRPPAPPGRPIDDPGLRRLPLKAIDSRPFQAINSRLLARRPQPSTHADAPNSGRSRAIDSRPSAPRPRLSFRANHPGSGRIGAISSRRTAARSRSLIRVDDPCKPSAVNKELEEADNVIQRLNELRLGDDISYEEYYGYLKQLPVENDVDTCTKLDALQLKELNARHALYRIKYYQLSQQVPEDKLCYDKLQEDYPPSRLEERFFKCYEEDGKLGWSFHPDYCKLAGLEDYQRLVPQNYGGHEYIGWDEYHKDLNSYEIEQEYIKYCEELSKKLKWMEAYVQNKPPSLIWGRILTRGTYQAIKIATGFSNISGGLAIFGFHEWFDSMRFDVCHFNEYDGVYYEIWQRYANEKKFRDALDEVYKLNRFPLRQERMRRALENATFCFNLEQEFLAYTTCLKKFTEDKGRVTEEKARELILEALRKKREKPKFYEEYCRKKIDIARAIGLISS